VSLDKLVLKDIDAGIRTLQQVHATTHPAAHLGRNENAPRKTPDPEAEKLFQMLAEEAENDKE
jgi:hypothetical protein